MTTAIEIKICGISTPEAIDALVKGGAQHLGMIFFEKSPRHVSVDTAAALAERAAGRISKVAVSVDANDEYIRQIVDATDPDILQLHGSETPNRVKEIKRAFGLPVMKALALRERRDLDKVTPYLGIADRFLFDAKAPEDSDIPGGNGVAFDWEIMDHLPDNVPYMLSGGLDAENVSVAISKTGAKAIDVSSGVERSPGDKDIAMIENFLKTVAKLGQVS